jgi:hypothetical protein
MSPGVQIVLSGVLTFGVPLAFAARELILLRRPGRGYWDPEDPPYRAPVSPKGWQPSLPPLTPWRDPASRDDQPPPEGGPIRVRTLESV